MLHVDEEGRERERKGGKVKKKGQKAEGKKRGKEQERKKDKKEGRQDKGRKRWNIWKHCLGRMLVTE